MGKTKLKILLYLIKFFEKNKILQKRWD